MRLYLWLARKDSDMTEVTVMIVPVDRYYISKSINKIKPMEKDIKYLSLLQKKIDFCSLVS